MADKNFARSGTADVDLLADDDPLAELARLVGYEPRPVQDVSKPTSEPVQAVPRRDNPVLALEDELMRAFEQYDTPNRAVVQPVVTDRVTPRHVEPLFDMPEPVAEDRDSLLDEAPRRDVAVGDVVDREPAFEDSADEPSFVEEKAEPVFVEEVAEEPVIEPEPEFETEREMDAALLLADELESAVHEVPSVNAEPVTHAGQRFADRLEPRFEAPARIEPIEIVQESDSRQPAFLGLQPLVSDESAFEDIGLDLERELELSIGDGFADELLAGERAPSEQHAEATFNEAVPVAAGSHDEPNFDGWSPDIDRQQDAEPFQAKSAYAKDEPHFVAEMPFENREERARAVAEAEMQWQAEEPARDATPDYRVESVEKGGNYDRDALLAEIERYPVPDTRPALAVATAATPRNPTSGASAIFGRATPVVHRQPVAETARTPFVESARDPVVERVQTPIVEPRREPVVEAVQTPVLEARREPAPVAAEPEVDFDNLEFDLSDLDLDLSDFSLDETPVTPEIKAEVTRPVETQTTLRREPLDALLTARRDPVGVETPVRREPAVAVPVSTYTAPQPVIAETADGSLPFDPRMIAETDEGVSPVTELDVPQLPVIEKEKPPVYQPDYDFDIDAEMAQLFNEPAAKTRTENLQAGVAAGAVAAAASQPVTQINDVDDFERALEEDFRRSLNQPERMAIPVDPGQANTLYAGDGYDDEQSRPRRGLLIAASIAALVLVGGGGVYAWTTFAGGSVGSGEPRVILADKEPVKIVPEEKGGKTVPNQDKAVYDRVAGDTAATPQQEQLVTSTEEPVDVVQRTLTPETLPMDGPEDGVEAVINAEEDSRVLPGVDEPETAATETGNTPLISPRKVKTMIVKPDGTLVAREETVTEPATDVAGLDAKATATTGTVSGEATATANATVDTNTSLSAEQAAGEGQPRSALAEVANVEVDDTAPVRTVKTTTIGATETATATSTESNTPVPETRPIDQPVTVVGTVTENGNVSGTETAEAKPAENQTRQTAEEAKVAAVPPGSYVIQIASLPSEAEAQKSYNSLSSKFSSVIGGRGVDIKKAEIPNKGTFFRVRIPAGSREEANSLCSRYKSAGGSCLVTR